MKNVRFSRNGVEFEPTKQELKIVLDDFAKQLGERDKRIADLERQLAENEKANEYFADRVEKADKEIKEIYKKYNKLVEEYNNLKEEVDNNFVDEQEYNELKQQLAESKKSKESFKVMYFNKCLEYEHLHEKFDDKCVEFELKECDYKQTIFEKTQDKIDFAIEQLEKVKEYVDNLDTPCVASICNEYMCDIEDYIDNQIKELKGEDEK